MRNIALTPIDTKKSQGQNNRHSIARIYTQFFGNIKSGRLPKKNLLKFCEK